MEKQIPIYKMKYSEDSELGVYKIDLVDEPAIEADFIKLSKEKLPVQLTVANPEKQLLIGPALIPDKQIYRIMQDKEFYIYYDKETIELIAHDYLKNGRQYNVGMNHQSSDELLDVTLVEQWIVADSQKDKSTLYFQYGHPVGTWMCIFKVNNPELWNQIKESDLKGFSIEGIFEKELVEEKTPELLAAEEKIAILTDLIKDFKC